jgi:proteasome lid subunit RPN8/RPN11
MIDLSTETQLKIKQHANSVFPQECCGVVLDGGEYIPCRNIALGMEEDDFVLDPEDFAAAEDKGDITAIIHSHPNGDHKASEADQVSCEKSGKPWYILSWPAGNFGRIEPKGYVAPLEGRQFAYGVLDCLSLVIDYYKKHLEVDIKYFQTEFDWWSKGENYYQEKWDSWTEGVFTEIKDHSKLKKHDILLMQVASNVPNHAGVYLGNNMVLHHLMGRLSTKDVFSGYFQKHTIHVLRHKSQC